MPVIAPPASPKTADVLDSARALFLAHGIRRVSVEAICKEAGVSKRTFYKYFRNRDDVATRVVAGLIENGRRHLEEVLDSDIPIEVKALQVIEIKSELASGTSLEFYRELLTSDSGPGRFARDKQQEWDERVRRFYADAQARGEIRADLDVDLLVLVLGHVRDMLKDPALQEMETSFSGLARSLMTLCFYGIVPRSDTPSVAVPASGGGHHD